MLLRCSAGLVVLDEYAVETGTHGAMGIEFHQVLAPRNPRRLVDTLPLAPSLGVVNECYPRVVYYRGVRPVAIGHGDDLGIRLDSAQDGLYRALEILLISGWDKDR